MNNENSEDGRLSSDVLNSESSGYPDLWELIVFILSRWNFW